MPVQLPTDIYRRIIHYLVSSKEDISDAPANSKGQLQTFGLPATAIRRSNQASLANLMQVLKVSSIVYYVPD